MMLPISPSAERAGVGVGLDAEHGADACARPSSPITSSAVASTWPVTGTTTPHTTSSGAPAASTASASSSADALGTDSSIELPSSEESAVPAVPEPMFASSRRASSWRSV